MSDFDPFEPPDFESGGLEKPRHGGRRAGAGRPPGISEPLPRGVVAAIKAARLRVPEDASPEIAQLAGRALERIVDVMEDECGQGALAVLSAARVIREEICGPAKQKVEHSFSGLTDEQLEAKKAALLAKWSGTKPPEPGE